MLEKIANLTTLRNITKFSNAYIKQKNIIALRCYSTQFVSSTYSSPTNYLSKPIDVKNAFPPTSFQLKKVISNNFIQTRCKSTHGDHVSLWKFERIVAAAFIPLLPCCFLFDNPLLDSLLAVLSVMHVHWGLEAIIIDYARPIVVGPIIPKLCFILLYLTSALTLAGLLVLIYNGPGLSKVIKQGWAIGNEKDKAP